MRAEDILCRPRDEKPCRLLNMHDCTQPLWMEINHQIAHAKSHLQPRWFRPFLKVPWVRRRLGYGHWSRVWEYPWAIENAELKPGMRLLDVGSGGSAFPVFLGFQGFEVHAIDPSLDYLGEANLQDWRKRLLRSIGFTFDWGLSLGLTRRQVPVVYASYPVQALPYDDDFFDRVFCLSVMEHIPAEEWGMCLFQMARILRPGGRLLMTLDMTTPQADNYHYKNLCGRRELQLLNKVDYIVPISNEDKQRRHPGYSYEVLGLAWEKDG